MSKLESPASKSVSEIEEAPPAAPQAISTGGAVTTEAYISENEKAQLQSDYKIPFKWSQLWSPEIVNSLNQKSYTLPLLYPKSPYFRAFWLATLSFFVAFLSWFAFSPLLPETVRSDLKLTAIQISNSNITALSATLLVRMVAGPMVDRYGPRKVMAALLVIGAIPSGLAGTAHGAKSLYAVRFFIGILGGTFVPCQAWTTAFFDKSIVGTANALSGGWGNLGGGVTFAVQVALFERLRESGLSAHISWRLCFVIVPVPILFLMATANMLFGKDHPMGRWSDRHSTPATEIALLNGEKVELDASEVQALENRDQEKVISEKAGRAMLTADIPQNLVPLDTAVNEPVTFKVWTRIASDPRTWLITFTYATSFGFELVLDATLANILFALFKSRTFGEIDAGYLAATYGLLNICFRLFGGIISDVLYARMGIQAKKWFMLGCAFAQGIFAIALGQIIEHHKPTRGVVMGFIVLIAVTGFSCNGAVYSLVPHINPKNNGVMCGFGGAGGNLGGIIYAVIFRFSQRRGTNLWRAGIFNVALNALCALIPLGDAA